MWTDVYDKWGTGEHEDVPCKFAGQTIMLSREKCEAGLGDLVKEYVRILRTPWWRRTFGWGFAEKFLRKRLNVSILEWHK